MQQHHCNRCFELSVLCQAVIDACTRQTHHPLNVSRSCVACGLTVVTKWADFVVTEKMTTPILQGIVWSGDLDGTATAAADAPAPAAPQAAPKLVAGLKRARPDGGGTAAPVAAAPAAATGDGGLQWRAAVLKRARAESEKTGQSLEDCVRERYGSVRELTGGAAPEAFLRRAAAAARHAPRRGRGYGRGRAAVDPRHAAERPPAERPPAERPPRVRLHGEQTDADLLRSYSQKLETQFGSAMKGVKSGKGGKGARAGPPARAPTPAPADRAGGGGWVGIGARTTLGGGSSFERGWRRRGGGEDKAPPPPPSGGGPPPPAADQYAGTSNAGAAEAMRRRLGK